MRQKNSPRRQAGRSLPRNSARAAILAAAALAGIGSLFNRVARAANAYWDGDGIGTVGGGTGTWDHISNRWSSSPSGSSYSLSTSTDDAFFGGAGGFVMLPSNLTVNSVNITASGYTFWPATTATTLTIS